MLTTVTFEEQDDKTKSRSALRFESAAVRDALLKIGMSRVGRKAWSVSSRSWRKPDERLICCTGRSELSPWRMPGTSCTGRLSLEGNAEEKKHGIEYASDFSLEADVLGRVGHHRPHYSDADVGRRHGVGKTALCCGGLKPLGWNESLLLPLGIVDIVSAIIYAILAHLHSLARSC